MTVGLYKSVFIVLCIDKVVTCMHDETAYRRSLGLMKHQDHPGEAYDSNGGAKVHRTMNGHVSRVGLAAVVLKTKGSERGV